ncbi:MAG TPA: DUF4198 domain-containing protein [Candidatus Nanoarchaeia archaeon]|nr:DUF4198 domain-containing protein [Candidatus Nanoarchaeia archaeon]
MRRVMNALLAICLLSAVASAHDLYLITGTADSMEKACAGIGERFPNSDNAVTSDRVERFRFVSGTGSSDLKGKGDRTYFCAPLPAGQSGVVEMVIPPRYIRLDAKDFNEYAAAEGFDGPLSLRKQRGQTDSPGREVYSRYSKLLVGTGADLRPLNHVLEIVPEKDPASLRSGESLPVRVLFRGKPLSGVKVSAMYADAPAKGHSFPVSAFTDQQGRAELKLDRPGLWYTRLSHMTPAQDPDFEWRSFFATLTFRAGGQAR